MNVKNVVQNMFEPDKIMCNAKELLDCGRRGNELAYHMKNEINSRERISIPYLRRQILYKWLQDVIEQARITTLFEHHVQQITILTGIMRVL